MKWFLIFLMLGTRAWTESVIYTDESPSQAKVLKYENIFFQQSFNNSYDLGFKLLPPPLVSSEVFRAAFQKDCEAFSQHVSFYKYSAESFEQDRYEPLAYTMRPSYEVFLELPELNYKTGIVSSLFINFESISSLQIPLQRGSYSELVKRMNLKAAQIEFVSETGFKALKITARDLACDLINRPFQVELLQNHRVGIQSQIKQNLNRVLKKIGLLVKVVLQNRNITNSKTKAAQLGFGISVLFDEHLLEKNRPHIRKFWSSVFIENSLNYLELDLPDQTFEIAGRLYEIQ